MSDSDRSLLSEPCLPRTAEVAAAGRLSNLLVASEITEADLPRLERPSVTSLLRVGFVSAPVGLGAEEPGLLARASHLATAGAEVSVVWRGRVPSTGDPSISFIESPLGGEAGDVLPACDVIVVGCWDLVLPARRLGFAPVVLLEQGDLAALGAVPENLTSLIRRALAAASQIWAPAEADRRHLSSWYGRDALDVPLAAPVSGSRHRDELFARCETLARAVPVRNGPPDSTLDLDGLELRFPSDAAFVEERLQRIATSDLVVPVVEEAIGPYRVVRWRVVGHRAERPQGTTRLSAVMRAKEPCSDAWHQEGLELLRGQCYEEALDYFAARCEAGAQAEQAVAGRWLVLSLLALGRAGDAADLAIAFARDFLTHPDFLYLAVVAARAAGRPIDVVGPASSVRLLGEGSQFDEWFENPSGLLSEHLRTGWRGLDLF